MNKRHTISRAGYYCVSLHASSTGALVATNTERAFVIAQLQDILCMRSLLEEPDAYQRLASHLDLLAFSILTYNIQLVVFAISPKSASALASILLNRLLQFQSDFQGSRAPHHNSPVPLITVRSLSGPHEALNLSVHLHLHHSDWEFDRYSSIGFFLHDRRGDWMRIWRLSHLYDNDTNNYYRLIRESLKLSKRIAAAYPTR